MIKSFKESKIDIMDTMSSLIRDIRANKVILQVEPVGITQDSSGTSAWVAIEHITRAEYEQELEERNETPNQTTEEIKACEIKEILVEIKQNNNELIKLWNNSSGRGKKKCNCSHHSKDDQGTTMS